MIAASTAISSRSSKPTVSRSSRLPLTRFKYSVPTFLRSLVDWISHTISAAQRYSFILNATQKADNYWIRAQPTLPGSNTGFANAINSAILRYAGARVADPTTSAGASTLPLLETNLHPLVQTPVPGAPHPGGADLVLNLVITLDTASFRFALNNVVCQTRLV